MVNIYKELADDFLEISPQEFYRDIFPLGELDGKDSFTKGKYTGIACEFCNVKKPNGKELVKRYSITDDLSVIDELLESENFIIISPISYAGKSRKTENARYMYAFAIEIDGLRTNADGKQIGYFDLIHQINIKMLPRPTYIVCSGNGLHLYYVFDIPLTLFPNVKKSLKNYKKAITRFFWNRYITTEFEEEKIQYESAFQGFRLVGGVTKEKERTKVFRVSDKPVSIEYMNDFVSEEDKIDIIYKSSLTLAQAKERYPKWYEDRIEKKKPKGSWKVKRDLYDWWLRKLRNDEAKVGHRYYCLMILCVYAIKCDISREELERDCYSLVDKFDAISLEENNRFTVKDMADALQSFEDKGLVTYPIDIISKRSGIFIKKNKRNFRKQNVHLERARAVQAIDYPTGEWRNKDGRPFGSGIKFNIVSEWQKKNPEGKKAECVRETGLSKPTVYKWWNEV
jgi:hypothetical protein